MPHWYESLLDKSMIPDALIRAGIRRLLGRRLRQEDAGSTGGNELRKAELITKLKSGPIAVNTADANTQHYEVPTAFYLRCLGPHLKYSGCLWSEGVKDLAAAERAMLDLYAERAQLADGQQILELGCGWGSFCLYAAARFPGARIVAVSNSRTQKEFIDGEARKRGLGNLTVITSDINRFDIGQQFDRVVSVEMFEHCRNYERLFAKVATWLKRDGLAFVHIFAHKRFAYLFEPEGDHDWMARHFFTGGIMPSFDLFRHFDTDLRVVRDWEVDGTHYEKTCNAWLANMDAHRDELMGLFRDTYGFDEALKWWSRWRIFHMACAELFGYRRGTEWIVAHYLLKPARA